MSGTPDEGASVSLFHFGLTWQQVKALRLGSQVNQQSVADVQVWNMDVRMAECMVDSL